MKATYWLGRGGSICRKGLLLAGGTTSLALAMPAFAQSAENQVTPEADEQLATEGVNADVVVTATKRAGAIAQRTPIAISALSAEQLEVRQVRTVSDLSFTLPSVSLGGVGTIPGGQNFSIRGLGINSSQPSVETAVGVFKDGIYLGTTYGVITDMFGIESFEALRGPQGILFGRNVTGGAILIRSKRPVVGEEMKAEGLIRVESGPMVTGGLSISTPVGPHAALGVTGYVSIDKGYFDNLTLNNDHYGRSNTWFVRPVAVWEPIEQLDTTLIVETGHITGDGAVNQATNIRGYTGPFGGLDTGPNEEGYVDTKWTQVTSETNLKVGLGDGVITNLFGYRYMTSAGLTDVDGLPVTAFHIQLGVKARQFSNELRYAGTFGNGFWDVTAGLFYFSQDLVFRERRFLGPGGALTGTYGGNQQSKSYAAFINNDLHLSDQLMLTLGARYGSETKDAQISYLAFGSASQCQQLQPRQVDVPCTFANPDAHGTFRNFSPKIGLQYEFNNNHRVFASWTRGFRAGGFGLRAQNIGAAVRPPFEDEKVSAYEVGSKNDFFDRKLRLNLGAYYYDIKNLQREIGVPSPIYGQVQSVYNSANAEVWGVELEGALVVNGNFSIPYSASYNKGRYTQVFYDISGNGSIGPEDYALKLPRLYPWIFNIGGIYNHDIRDGKLQIQANFSHRDSGVVADNNATSTTKADLVNASINYAWGGDRRDNFEISLFGRNLTNDVYEETLTALPASVAGQPLTPRPALRFIQKGRVLGISFRFRH